MINSDFIKTALMLDYRFARKCNIIATEVGAYSSDFLAVSNCRKKLIEVEIKISKQDLIADFKKEKHQIYKEGKRKFVGHDNIREFCEYTPHEFHFCVPSDLVNDAIELTNGTNYGVIKCGIGNGSVSVGRTVIVKRAKKLHTKEISQNVIDNILKRMASELANLRQFNINGKKWNT